MKWLNENSNALMVIITFVYVVATIAICIANIKSAKASKEQLEESKMQYKDAQDQYEESERIRCMPFLQVEKYSGGLGEEDFSMELSLCQSNEPYTEVRFYKLKNLGNGPAICLIYSWNNYSKDPLIEPMPICGIRAGDEYIVRIEFELGEDNHECKAYCEFKYLDICNNDYVQRVYFELYDGDIICNNDLPKLC